MRLPSLLPRLTFPKQVEIRNDRLQAVYFSLTVATAVCLVVKIFVRGEMYRQVPAGQHVQVTMWADGYRNLPLLQSVVDEHMASDLCRKPHLLDFQWDEAGKWMYEGYQCLPLCQASTRGNDGGNASTPIARRTCADRRESYRRESRSQLTLVTEIEETVITDTGSKPTEFYLVPTTEALFVSFTFEFTIPSGGTGGTLSGDSAVNVLTVVLDTQGGVFRVVPPSPSIDLTVPELLQLSGRPLLLDSVNVEAGRNWLPQDSEAEMSGPHTRITGAEIVLLLDCYNRHPAPLGPEWAWWEGPVCYVSAHVSQTTWVQGESLDVLDAGQTLHQSYHGVRVRFDKGGMFWFPDPNNIYVAVLDAIVLLSIPKRLLLFFITMFLGSLSRVYKRALIEPFDIMAQLGGMSARVAGQSVQFVELEDQTGDCRGISRDRLSERLHETFALQDKKLNSTELEKFVDVCFGALVTRFALEEEKGHGVDSGGDVDLGQVLNLETFSVACSCTDPIEIGSAMDLFDQDRPVSSVEWFFTPSQIKKTVTHHRRTAAERARSLQPPQSAQMKIQVAPLPPQFTGLASEPPRAPVVDDAAHAAVGPVRLEKGASQTLEAKKKAANDMQDTVAHMLRREDTLQRDLEDCREFGGAFESRIASLADSVEQLSQRLAGMELLLAEQAKLPTISARLTEASGITEKLLVDLEQRMLAESSKTQERVNALSGQLEREKSGSTPSRLPEDSPQEGHIGTAPAMHTATVPCAHDGLQDRTASSPFSESTASSWAVLAPAPRLAQQPAQEDAAVRVGHLIRDAGDVAHLSRSNRAAAGLYRTRAAHPANAHPVDAPGNAIRYPFPCGEDDKWTAAGLTDTSHTEALPHKIPAQPQTRLWASSGKVYAAAQPPASPAQPTWDLYTDQASSLPTTLPLVNTGPPFADTVAGPRLRECRVCGV